MFLTDLLASDIQNGSQYLVSLTVDSFFTYILVERHVAAVCVMIVNCWTSHSKRTFLTTFRSVCADLPQEPEEDQHRLIETLSEKFSCRVKSNNLQSDSFLLHVVHCLFS